MVNEREVRKKMKKPNWEGKGMKKKKKNGGRSDD